MTAHEQRRLLPEPARVYSASPRRGGLVNPDGEHQAQR